jgi:hypothetical protein
LELSQSSWVSSTKKARWLRIWELRLFRSRRWRKKAELTNISCHALPDGFRHVEAFLPKLRFNRTNHSLRLSRSAPISLDKTKKLASGTVVARRIK